MDNSHESRGSDQNFVHNLDKFLFNDIMINIET
jgi:hypothetical protein